MEICEGSLCDLQGNLNSLIKKASSKKTNIIRRNNAIMAFSIIFSIYVYLATGTSTILLTIDMVFNQHTSDLINIILNISIFALEAINQMINPPKRITKNSKYILALSELCRKANCYKMDPTDKLNEILALDREYDVLCNEIANNMDINHF